MLEINWLTILIIAAVMSALMCARLAKDRNRNVPAWFFIGLVCNLPTLVVLVRLKRIEEKEGHDD